MKRVLLLLLLIACAAANFMAQYPPSAPADSKRQTKHNSQRQNKRPTPAREAKAQPPYVPAAGDPFFAPVAISLGKESMKERISDYAIVAFGPRAFVGPALSAAIVMARPPRDYPRDWKDGGGAFGRNYGGDLATAASLQAGRFFTGALLQEDFRYRPSASQSFLPRSLHAVAFTFVDKSASGQNRIALANFAGAAAGGFVGMLYLPPPYNSPGHAGVRTAEILGGLAGQNLLREFAPDIQRFTSKFHIPFPRIPIPAWWTRRKN